MRTVRSVEDISAGLAFAVTIGAFDGVHLGHQSLIAQLTAQARRQGLSTLVVTFDPDPAEVVLPNPPPYLSSLQQRIELIGALGVDELAVVHFDERVRSMRADEFLDWLRAHASLRELLVGHDFAMGHDRHGTRTVLQEYAAKHGFACAIADALLVDGQPVSASHIRQLLGQGNIEGAKRLLGRPPSVSGVVVEGDKRGRLIGFPTANLGLNQRWAIPGDGVYVAYTQVQGGRHQSVVNIGLRPTFDLHQRTIESHILDFSADIYGQPITVEFLHKLRGEQKFSGIDAIREQIGRDVQAARQYFSA